MSSSPDDSAAALPSMALLATLQTATTVWEAVEERRAGRDPSAQEPAAAARASLEAAVRELTRLHMQILMAKVQAARPSAEDDAAGQGTEPKAEAPASDQPPTARSDSGEDDPAEPASPAPPPSAFARLAVTVRRFDLLMKLRRTDRLLHSVHQRLMSLYPAVSEELVEEARRCRGALSRVRTLPGSTSARAAPTAPASPADLPSAGGFDARLDAFLQRLLSLAAWIQHEL